MVFIKKPEPAESATASAMPIVAASIREVDTEGRTFLLRSPSVRKWKHIALEKKEVY